MVGSDLSHRLHRSQPIQASHERVLQSGGNRQVGQSAHELVPISLLT